MKRFITIALVALVALAALAMPVSAADSVTIRSTIVNGTNFSEIFESGASYINDTTGYIKFDAFNFAGFWADLDDNLASETLEIINNSDFVDGTDIEENGLIYTATIQQTAYEATEFDNETGATEFENKFPIVGLFAEPYVALDNNDAGELVKLLMDSDDKYTLRTGSALELPNGYAIAAKQIDVEGNKVWMELSKDGEFVEDEVITMPTTGAATWDYDVDVGDQDDVIVFRVLVTDVFQGQVDSLAVIEGLWLIDYENILEIETSDEFGELEVDGVTSSIVMKNTGTLSLTPDKTVDIAEGMFFMTANDANDNLRFFVAKEYTTPGTYVIRGNIVDEDTTDYSWNAFSFAAFWADLDDGIGSENLVINGTTFTDSDRSIEEGDLIYNATIQQTAYEGDFAGEDAVDSPKNETYPIIGLFAQPYVPLDDSDAGELVMLLMDTDDKYTLRTGSALELPNGYAITAKQIDVEGDKVWMELTKDGEFVEDEVVDTTAGAATWDYDVDVGDQDDVIVFRVQITDVFQGQVDSLAVIEGLWLIDYENILEIETSDEFGELEVNSLANGVITMSNTGTISLGKGDSVDIAEGMKFEVADASVVRFYPFVERTIGEDDTGTVTDGEGTDEPMPVDDETPVDDAAEPVDDAAEPVDDAAEPVDEAPVEDEGTEEPAPGFEAIFAVAGLLAVAYLVRRN